MTVPRAAAALLVALASLPLVHADPAADVTASMAPAPALLGEPVTFTASSTDPTASFAWEFSDGRRVPGAVVTRAFDYAGVHETRLFAGGSLAATLDLVVLAPIMEGRATAFRVGEAAFADTGPVSTDDHEDHAASFAEVQRGGLRVAGAFSELRTLENRAVARTDVGHVKIPVPIGYILVTGVEAEAIVGCAYPTLVSSRFTQLRLNDGPLVPPGSVPPGTRIELPGGGAVELDVREPTATGGLAVTALRVVVPGAPTVEVARAEAGVRHCPYAG